MTTREYIKSILPSKMRADLFLDKAIYEDPIRNNYGARYSSKLGWLRKSAHLFNGIGGSRTFNTYIGEGDYVARKYSTFEGVGPRIHTFGNSFTQCSQVSDGETFQEYLAQHLGEPVINYGVGGHSVYQMYLRMKMIGEVDTADYVILNIWEDDHFRSLDAWRAIRYGSLAPGGWPLPHVRVDMPSGTIEERPNLCSTEDDIQQMCDIDFVEKLFADDPILKFVMACRNNTPLVENDDPLGLGLVQSQDDESSMPARRRHVHAALFASRNIVQWAQQLAKERNQKLMIIMSYTREYLEDAINGKPRWDQDFLNHLAAQPLPVFDLADSYMEAFKTFKGSPKEFLSQYFIGHHSPAGNYFFAESLRKPLVDWLNPKPPAYHKLQPFREFFPDEKRV